MKEAEKKSKFVKNIKKNSYYAGSLNLAKPPIQEMESTNILIEKKDL